jgi:hypothetical protein
VSWTTTTHFVPDVNEIGNGANPALPHIPGNRANDEETRGTQDCHWHYIGDVSLLAAERASDLYVLEESGEASGPGTRKTRYQNAPFPIFFTDIVFGEWVHGRIGCIGCSERWKCGTEAILKACCVGVMNHQRELRCCGEGWLSRKSRRGGLKRHAPRQMGCRSLSKESARTLPDEGGAGHRAGCIVGITREDLGRFLVCE